MNEEFQIPSERAIASLQNRIGQMASQHAMDLLHRDEIIRQQQEVIENLKEALATALSTKTVEHRGRVTKSRRGPGAED